MSLLFGSSKYLDELYFELYWEGVESDNDKERVYSDTSDERQEGSEGAES